MEILLKFFEEAAPQGAIDTVEMLEIAALLGVCKFLKHLIKTRRPTVRQLDAGLAFAAHARAADQCRVYGAAGATFAGATEIAAAGDGFVRPPPIAATRAEVLRALQEMENNLKAK